MKGKILYQYCIDNIPKTEFLNYNGISVYKVYCKITNKIYYFCKEIQLVFNYVDRLKMEIAIRKLDDRVKNNQTLLNYF